MTTTEITATAAARPLAATGAVAATSHTRAAGLTAQQRERRERRAIKNFVKRHRSRSCPS